MALVFEVEDGTGKDDATSYVETSVAQDYVDSHLYASQWPTTYTEQQKALVMATRTLDYTFEFVGQKSTDTQALQWPRDYVPIPGYRTQYFDSDEVPRVIKDATVELALQLINENRTEDDPSRGLKEVSVGKEAVKVVFSKEGKQKRTLPDIIIQMLAGLGSVRQSPLIRRTRREF